MSNKLKVILISLITFILIIVISITLSNNTKGTSAVDSYPSDEVVESIVAAMLNEIGCGETTDPNSSKDAFVYQMIWVGVLVNQYNYYFEKRKTPSTVVFDTDKVCDILKRGGEGGSYDPDYCHLTIAEVEETNGKCKQYQYDQLKLATKMVLTKSFNIPKNIYLAARRYVAESTDPNDPSIVLNENFVCWRPILGGLPYPRDPDRRFDSCYSTGLNDPVDTEDIYGNTVSSKFEDYQKLANCLYDHPTLFGAYNKCSETPTIYKVYLDPNGGVFSDGTTTEKTFEYTETTLFSKFPEVKRANCKLDGWNLENGTEYYTDVRPKDDGKKLYARWVCQESSSSSSSKSSSSSSSKSSSSRTDISTFIVTFKNGTDIIFHQEEVKENTKVTFPSKIPDREGYSFEGWITKDGEKFDFNTRITDNITLYASWKSKATSSYSNSHIVTSSTKPQSSSRQEVDNPQTGTLGLIIFIVLMIPTSLAVFVYYQNYIIKSKSQ